jgi:hypothetical protein
VRAYSEPQKKIGFAKRRAHETENEVGLGLPRIIRPKETAPELDYSSFYGGTCAGRPAQQSSKLNRNPVDVLKSQIRLTAMYARPREQLAMSEARKIEQILEYITRF